MLTQTGKPLRKHERMEVLKGKGEIEVRKHGSEEAGERRAIEAEGGEKCQKKGKRKIEIFQRKGKQRNVL